MTTATREWQPAMRPSAPEPPALRPPAWFWTVVVVAVGTLAFVVRVRLLTQSGGLIGSDGYDDGVYYAAADALVHGRLPYRDFLLLQPPGSTVALAPFAWFGSITSDPTGVIAARLAFIGVGAVNALLVMRIARRFGTVAALVGGIGYALCFPAAFSERSTLVEPLGTCALLVAVLLVDHAFRRPRLGMALAGLAAGLSLGMRIWYVVPVLLIGAIRPRRAAPYLIGAAVSGAAVYLPFFIASPAELIQQVLLDQLQRARSSLTPLQRSASFLGATNLHLHQPWSSLLSTHKVGAVLLLVVVACAIAALTVRGARRFPLLAAAAGLVLVASPSFFLHYGAFTAPWVVLTVAVGAARIAALGRHRSAGRVVVVALLIAISCYDLRAVQVARASAPIPVAVLRPAVLAVRGCVTSDDPQTLAALDVLSRDLARGCVVWPDVTGYTYDRDADIDHGVAASRIQNEAWQRDVARYLLSGDAVIVHRAATGLDPATNHLVRSGRVLAHTGTWTLHAAPR